MRTRLTRFKRPLGLMTAACAIVTATVVAAASPQTKTAKPPAKRTTAVFTCAAELGMGTASRRRFCDVIVASVAAESVSLTIPAHSGPA